MANFDYYKDIALKNLVGANPYLEADGALRVPTGATTERPSAPRTGDIRYNTSTTSIEYYTGSIWESIDSPGVAFQQSYQTASINLGLTNDGSFVAADATNAKLTFDVEQTGVYLVTCSFTHIIISDGTTTNASSETLYRLSDGTNTTALVDVGLNFNTGLTVSADTPAFFLPVSMIGLFAFTDTGSQTITLQKRNITSNDLDTRSIGASTGLLELKISAVRVARV